MSDLERVYAQLLARAPENKIEPRMDPIFRAMEILGSRKRLRRLYTSPVPTEKLPPHA